MNKKFEQMIDNYYNGNLIDFRTALKKLNKAELLRFCTYCATYAHLDIYIIEKEFDR